MAEEQKGMVPGVSLETLGESIRLGLLRTFGRPIEEWTSSRHKTVYHELAREVLRAAHLKVPIKRVRGKIRVLGVVDSRTVLQWLEPNDGSSDVRMTSFGDANDLIEIVQVETD